MHAWTGVFAALPLPRHAAQAAADLAAKHTAATGLRSPDRGRSGPCFRHQRGSLGPFFVRAARPGAAWYRSAWLALQTLWIKICLFKILLTLMYCFLARARLASCRRLAQRLTPGKGSCEDASSNPAAGDLFCADRHMRLFFF